MNNLDYLGNLSRRTARVIAIALAVLALHAASSAEAAQKIVGLGLASANVFNMCVASTWDEAPGPKRDAELDDCCNDAYWTCQDLCEAQYPGQSEETDEYWYALQACNEACGRAQTSCYGGALVTPASLGAPGLFDDPRVEEISPSPRVDTCLENGVGCGGPAAHTFCARYAGAGFIALNWETDRTPASLEDPTWHLGVWFPRQPYSTGEGFEYIQCVESAHDPLLVNVYPDQDWDGVRDDADNCVGEPNPLQHNEDGDILGDLCDPEPQTVYACSNGIDDDGDGFPDASDLGCDSLTDTSENGPAFACDDGIDNDGDGHVDLEDADCQHPYDPSENVERCQDGLDDDGDGLTDMADPGCESPRDPSEYGDLMTTEFGYDRQDEEPLCFLTFCIDRDWWWYERAYSRHLADVDGDGREDIVGFGRFGVEVALSTETGFGPSTHWTEEFDLASFGSSNSNDAHTQRFVRDIDGDGLADLVVFYPTSVVVARSTGTNFAAQEVWSSGGDLGSDRFYTDGWANDPPSFLRDMNGDGRPDLVAFDELGTVVALHTGSGFAASTYWSPDFGDGDDSPIRGRYGRHDRHLGDWNGDGLLDIVAFNQENLWVAYSTGSGFEPAELLLHDDEGPWQWVEKSFLADFDGDGRDDFISVDSINVRVLRSEPTERPTIEWWLRDHGGWGRSYDIAIAEDLNHDGFSDLLMTDGRGVSVWHSNGEGFHERIVVGYGMTNSPLEHWTIDGLNSIRLLSDFDGDGEVELVGFGVDGVVVGDLEAARASIPAPEPGVPMMLAAGAGMLVAFRRRRAARRSLS